MDDKQGKHVRISRSGLAVATVSAVGIALTFIFPGVQAQNAIQIGSCGALAGILLRGVSKADAVVKAAVHLADRLADQTRTTEDDDGARAEQLAPVVPLPQQRSEVS